MVRIWSVLSGERDAHYREHTQYCQERKQHGYANDNSGSWTVATNVVFNNHLQTELCVIKAGKQQNNHEHRCKGLAEPGAYF